jgi:hypothetical protein
MTDIELGSRWSVEIAGKLESTQFGLICVTAENQTSPWVNFEAGALAKSMDEARVVPIAIDLDKGHVKQPLGQFQTIEATKSSFRDLVGQLNDLLPTPIDAATLSDTFEAFWPSFQERLAVAKKDQPSTKTTSDSRGSQTDGEGPSEVLLDVLNTVRSIARTQDRFLRQSARERAGRNSRWETEDDDEFITYQLLSQEISGIAPGSTVAVKGSHVTVKTEPLTKKQRDEIARAIAEAGYKTANVEDTLEPPEFRSSPYGDMDPGAF